MELNTALDVIKKELSQNQAFFTAYESMIFYCVYREINKHGTYEVFTANEQVLKDIILEGARNFLKEWVGLDERPMISSLAALNELKQSQDEPLKKDLKSKKK